MHTSLSSMTAVLGVGALFFLCSCLLVPASAQGEVVPRPYRYQFSAPNCVGPWSITPTPYSGYFQECTPFHKLLFGTNEVCHNDWWNATELHLAEYEVPCVPVGEEIVSSKHRIHYCVNEMGPDGSMSHSYMYECLPEETVQTHTVPGAIEAERYVAGPTADEPGETYPNALAWTVLYWENTWEAECNTVDALGNQNTPKSIPLVAPGYPGETCYATGNNTEPEHNVIFRCIEGPEGDGQYITIDWFRSGCNPSLDLPFKQERYRTDYCHYSSRFNHWVKYQCNNSNVEAPALPFAPDILAPLECDSRRTDQPGCPVCDPTKRTDCCDARRTDQPGCPACDPTKRTDCCDPRRTDQPGCPVCDPTKRTDCHEAPSFVPLPPVCDARRTDQPGCPPCDTSKRTDCCDARRTDQPGCPVCDPSKRTDCCDARRTDQPGCPACDPNKRTDCCDARRTDQPGCPACDATKRTDCIPATPFSVPMFPNPTSSTAPSAIPVTVNTPSSTSTPSSSVGGVNAASSMTFSAHLIVASAMVLFFH